jgi:hypothetical protein
MFTARFSELVEPLAYFQPGTRNPQTQQSAWVYAGNYHRFVAVIHVGAMDALATFAVTLREATDNAGTNAAAIGGKTVTLTQAGGDANQPPAVIELRGEELSNDGSVKYDYIQLQVVTAINNVTYAVELYGIEERFPPTAAASWNSITD